MTLSLQEVNHIAELARLELGEVELELYREQLSKILDYAQRLEEVDTSSIQPTSASYPPGVFCGKISHTLAWHWKR